MQLDPIIIGLLAVFAVLVVYTIFSFVTSRKPPAAPPKILTKIMCAGGNHSEVREFKEGDFVGKEVGKCPKCGSPLFIVAVYSEAQTLKEGSARS